MLENLKLKPADIGLSRHSGNWVSNGIRWFESLWQSKARYSHAWMMINWMALIESMFYVTVNLITKYEGKEIAIWRNKILTEAERKGIAELLITTRGTLYGITKIPLFALDHLFQTYWFTKKFGVTTFKVCSQEVGWGYYRYFKNLKESGIELDAIRERYASDLVFDVPWRCLDPDGIDDYCIAHPEEYELIFTNPLR
jgi:hypothetical protein